MLFGIPEFIQHAAVVALDDDLPELLRMRHEYRLRRDLVWLSLGNCQGLKPV